MKETADMRDFLALPSVVAFASVVLLAGGCARKGSAPPERTEIPFSDAELRYGSSPSRATDITYEPDVLKIDNGSEAVHNVSDDGLTWTFDANAPHAQDVAPGKVLFLTSRAVGRVLGVRRTGADLAVTLGPIAITDLIQKADISTDQPIDMNAMTAYVAPNYPQAPMPEPSGSAPPGWPESVAPRVTSIRMGGNPAGTSSGWTVVHALGRQALGSVFFVPAALAAGPPGSLDVSQFHVEPACCGGLGIKFLYDVNGTRFHGAVVVKVKAPRLKTNLKIDHGLKTATIELLGVAGLTMDLVADDKLGLGGNMKSPVVMVPVDISWPINLHPPFAMVLHQSFSMSTAFTSKNSTIEASGDYSFTGSFKMGWDNGSWGMGAPTSFTTNKSLVDSIIGIMTGPATVRVSYQMKIIVGVGAFGFVTGPYLGYTAGFGVVQQGAVGMPCHGGELSVGMNVGVGYSIPQPITSAINAVLHALNFSPVNGTGGFSHPFAELINKKGSFPGGCLGY
jgi:hypothetical protein